MKLLYIESILSRFESFKSSKIKNIEEIEPLKKQVVSMKKSYEEKNIVKTKDSFVNILNIILVDIDYEISKIDERVGA